MNKKLSLLGGTTLSAFVLLAATALPADAAAGDTDTTFVVAAGSLSVSVAATANLGTVATGATNVSGSLGAVDVTDARGGTLGWTTSATSTVFSRTGGGTTSTAVSYNSGAVTKTGTVTTASTGATPLIAVAAPVVMGTLVTGNNTANWNPTLTVTLPADALAGTYTGTVNTSVS